MAKGKIKKEQDPANSVAPSEAEVTKGLGETGTEGSQPGGTDVEQQKNSSVDSSSEETTIAEEGISNGEQSEIDTEVKDTAVDLQGKETAFLAEVKKIATKVFRRVPVNTLYFTSDYDAFADREDAVRHAKVLKDAKILAIKR